jgi:hypothetical protein
VQIRFWGIDSGIRHSVGGSDYRSVRVGAFMGLKLISQAQQRQQQLLIAQPSSSVAAVLTEVTSTNRTPSPSAGGSDAGSGLQPLGSGSMMAASKQSYLQHQQQQRAAGGGSGFFDATPAAAPQQQQHQHHPGSTQAADRASSGEGSAGNSGSGSSRCMPSFFGGYLANISPSEYRELYEADLPAALAGADFLRTYGPHLDTATAVDPGMVYAVKDPTVHPIFENHRWGHESKDGKGVQELGLKDVIWERLACGCAGCRSAAAANRVTVAYVCDSKLCARCC